MKFRTQLAILMLIAFAATGCIFSPGGDDDPPPPAPPINTCAESPDEVMQLFRTVYAARNLDAYSEILSQDYLWIPQGDDDEVWTYDIEIVAAERMFNGLAGNNDFIISSISVDELRREGVWEATPANDPNFGGFPGSQKCIYMVDFSFSFSGQNLIWRVQGPVIYYVMSETEGDQTCFKILGMVDHTFGN